MFTALLLLVAAQAALAQSGQVTYPWEAAPLSADPLEVRLAAQTLAPPAGANSEILMDEAVYEVTPDRSIRILTHLVVRVISEKDARRWEQISASWSPWLEHRPLLRARVIARDGSSRQVEAADIKETTAEPKASGARKLETRLPLVAAGSIIEETVERVLPSSLLKSGRIRRFTFGGDTPVARTRLIVRYPESAAPKFASRLPGTIRNDSEKKGGVVVRRWEADALAPVEEGERGAPADTETSSYVEFSTGSSWEAVADEYGDLLDAQIREARIQPLLEDAAARATAAGEPDRIKQIARLIAILHGRVKSDSAWSDPTRAPGKPDDVLRHRIGDGSDKAALLISLLRAVGLRAYAALISPRGGAEINPELPGREQFSDVLVYVEGNPATWIDPSEEFVRVGDVAWFKSGRLALVAGGPRSLLRTPALTPRDNRESNRWSVFLAHAGAERVLCDSSNRGVAEQASRSEFASGHPQIVEIIRKQTEQILGKNIRPSVSSADPRDLTLPFSFRVEMTPLNPPVEPPSGRSARLSLEVGRKPMIDQLLKILEFRLTARPAEKRRDVLNDLPKIREEVWRFIPGPGAEFETLPKCLATVDLGIGSYSEYCERESGGVFRLTRLYTLREGLPPSAVEAVRRALPRLTRVEPFGVEQVYKSSPR